MEWTNPPTFRQPHIIPNSSGYDDARSLTHGPTPVVGMLQLAVVSSVLISAVFILCASMLSQLSLDRFVGRDHMRFKSGSQADRRKKKYSV